MTKQGDIKPVRRFNVRNAGVGTASFWSQTLRQLGQLLCRIGFQFPDAPPDIGRRSEKRHSQMSGARRVHHMRNDLTFFLVGLCIDDRLPVFAIRRRVNFILVGCVVFLPVNSQRLNIFHIAKIHLPCFTFGATAGTPASSQVTINRVFREVIFACFFTTGGGGAGHCQIAFTTTLQWQLRRTLSTRCGDFGIDQAANLFVDLFRTGSKACFHITVAGPQNASGEHVEIFRLGHCFVVVPNRCGEDSPFSVLVRPDAGLRLLVALSFGLTECRRGVKQANRVVKLTFRRDKRLAEIVHDRVSRKQVIYCVRIVWTVPR